MKLFVNFLTVFRIMAAFFIIPTIMFNHYWLTFILYVLGATSDWFDGFLARKYNCTTKFGAVTDSISDKIFVCLTLVLLSIMTPVWFIIIPVLIMIAREFYVSGLREFAGLQKIEIHAQNRFAMGKIKTFAQMLATVAFFLMFAVGASVTPNTTSRFVFFLIYALPQTGVFCLWFAMVASIWSAAQYTHTFLQKMKKVK